MTRLKLLKKHLRECDKRNLTSAVDPKEILLLVECIEAMIEFQNCLIKRDKPKAFKKMMSKHKKLLNAFKWIED